MSDSFQVAAVQVAAAQVGGPVGDLDRLADLTARAAGQGARLVAWPECSYPAYFLRSAEHYRATAGGRLPSAAVLERVSGVARANGVYLVAGLVEELDDGRLANAAALFGPDGRELARHRKHVLWHFDNNYFVQGDTATVVDTDLGRIGLMICADGRSPELLAALAARGAQLVVNPTAWVSWGRSPEALGNANIDVFLPARAIENGCWYLSANKVGVEADSIVYCGRSNLIDPRGDRVAELGPADEGVLMGEVDLSACRPPLGGEWPEILFEPADELPITARLAQPPDARPIWLAAVAGTASEALADSLAAQSVSLLVLPDDGGDPADAWARWMQRLGTSGMMPCFTGRVGQMVNHGGLWLAGGRVDAFAPARAAMLGGADLFVADPIAGRCPDLRLLRSRAMENRFFVVAAAADRAVIVSPAGAVLADSLAGRSMAVSASVSPAATRQKTVVPGTDVVAGRDGATYRRWMERQDGK